MSMRIQSQTDANITSNARSVGAKAAGLESTAEQMPVLSRGADQVSLSSASGLTSLAKTLTPADKQAKVAALTLQVRSGQYRVDSSQISRSLVREHLNN